MVTAPNCFSNVKNCCVFIRSVIVEFVVILLSNNGICFLSFYIFCTIRIYDLNARIAFNHNSEKE